MEVKVFKDKAAVADYFAHLLAEALKRGKDFHVALSGGSTPKAIFDHLAENFKDQIPWSYLHLYWGDERCVPPNDEQSNHKMTVDHLLSKVNVPAKNIHRIKGENKPFYEASRYGKLLEQHLSNNNGTPIFDMVILGMGDDGHTASIFPHEIELWDSKKICEVATHPESGQKRITITGKVINAAKAVAFLVTGDNKKTKVDEILGSKNGADYPAAKVNPTSGNLTWLLDKTAAQLLEK